MHDWHLIIAGYTVQFKRELFYGQPVTIKTGVPRIGGNSFTIWQEAWQQGEAGRHWRATLIHFDYRAPIIPPERDSPGGTEGLAGRD